MWRCKHVKSQATTVYFRLGKLGRVSTYVQQVWGIIGHVTVAAGNTVGTDGAPPQNTILNVVFVLVFFRTLSGSEGEQFLRGNSSEPGHLWILWYGDFPPRSWALCGGNNSNLCYTYNYTVFIVSNAQSPVGPNLTSESQAILYGLQQQSYVLWKKKNKILPITITHWYTLFVITHF
jgi:hypothetical protein